MSADMKHVDMRELAPAAQAERQQQVIGLRQSGMSYAAIATPVWLSQTGVFDICKRFAAKGEQGLLSGKRGRKGASQMSRSCLGRLAYEADVHKGLATGLVTTSQRVAVTVGIPLLGAVMVIHAGPLLAGTRLAFAADVLLTLVAVILICGGLNRRGLADTAVH